jgi:hypothetical protein
LHLKGRLNSFTEHLRGFILTLRGEPRESKS